MQRIAVAVVVAAALLAPRDAHADGGFGAAAAAPALVAGLLVVGAIVAPIGAMINVVDGTPSKEWGRASMVFGGISVGAGTVPLIIGIVSERDRALSLTMGSIAISLGLGGLLWGGISEAMLPEEDPGIPGRPRPPGGSALTFEAQF